MSKLQPSFVSLYMYMDGLKDGWVGGWLDEWIGGWVDRWIQTYLHSWQADTWIEYTRLTYKNLFIAISHRQKCLKTAILDHFLAWKRGRRHALGFFSSAGKALLTFGYSLSTFPSCLVSLLTLFCFWTVRKYAQLIALPPKLFHVAITLYKHSHSHDDRSYMQFPVLFGPP